MNEPPPSTAPSNEGSRLSVPDPTAFADFVLRRHRLVRTYLARYVLDLSVADQLAREVFLEFAHQTDFQDISDHHLLKLAREKALRQLAKNASGSSALPGRKVATLLARWQGARLEAEAPEAHLVLKELTDLQESTQSLAPSSLAMLEAHYRHGRSAEEMGQAMDRDPIAIRQTLLKLRSATLQARDTRSFS